MKSAIVLAAGFGTRLRPHTLTTPKPLVKVGGVPLLERALIALEEAGVQRIVINIHYLGEQIIDFATHRHNKAELIISDERDKILDSGGGVTKALSHLDEMFFVLNADTFFTDFGENTLRAMVQNFKNEDCRMLLAHKSQSIGFTGQGDFTLHSDETLTRNGNLIYAGAHIWRKSCFKNVPAAPFSLNSLWDKSRLTGQVLNGTWYHIGDEKSLNEANTRLSSPSKER
jgi:N-acetyl-alpha-D-muramate 1-phosphate uridylyltransferase